MFRGIRYSTKFPTRGGIEERSGSCVVCAAVSARAGGNGSSRLPQGSVPGGAGGCFFVPLRAPVALGRGLEAGDPHDVSWLRLFREQPAGAFVG